MNYIHGNRVENIDSIYTYAPRPIHIPLPSIQVNISKRDKLKDAKLAMSPRECKDRHADPFAHPFEP